MDDNFILKNLEKIKNIPTNIIQGRYDVVCPPRSAWELNQMLNSSKLHMIEDAGHSMSEEGITRKLMEVLKKL